MGLPMGTSRPMDAATRRRNMVDSANAASPQGLLCPACRVDLVMSERQGIEIDYCPKCRGVWLDRGELDKIIERSLGEGSRGGQGEPAPQPRQPYPPQGHDEGGHDSERGGHGGRR